MRGGTGVVAKAGERELFRAHATSSGVFRLEHENVRSRRRQLDGGAQTVRPRADDDNIRICHEQTLAASGATDQSEAASARLRKSPPNTDRARTDVERDRCGGVDLLLRRGGEDEHHPDRGRHHP